MPTEIGTVNRALRRVGGNRIASFSDSTTEGALAKDTYVEVRDMMLGQYPWSFALKASGVLSQLATAQPEYEYAFSWPSDCLKPVKILGTAELDDDGELVYSINPATAPDIEYVSRDGKILTDEEDPVLLYVYRNTDITTYSALFVEALVYQLALEFSYALSSKLALVQTLERESKMRLSRAMAETGNTSKVTLSNLGASIVQARRSGTR